jgi:hypothetical protein
LKQEKSKCNKSGVTQNSFNEGTALCDGQSGTGVPRCYEFCQERCGARLLFFFFLKAVFVFCPFRLGRDFETFSRLGAI